MTGMELLGFLIFILGALLSVIGSIWFLVKMFQEGIWWGLGGLFCSGIIQLIFLFKFWSDVKTPFLVSLLGSLLFWGGMALNPELRAESMEMYEELEELEEPSSNSNEEEFSWQNAPEFIAPETAEEEQSPKPGTEAYRRQQAAALQDLYATQGNFSFAQVLEVDPHTLTTSEQFQRYARGLQMKKDDLTLRRDATDPADTQAVEELKKEVALFKQRYSEMKAALAQFRAEQSAAAGNTAGE